MTKIYTGRRRADRTCDVRIRNAGGRWQRLWAWRDLFNHSPTGFEWGYAGSGPAQLALAILADALGDDEKAVKLHQEFKRGFVAMLDREASWEITEDQVLEFVREYERHVAPATDGLRETDDVRPGPLLDPS